MNWNMHLFKSAILNQPTGQWSAERRRLVPTLSGEHYDTYTMNEIILHIVDIYKLDEELYDPLELHCDTLDRQGKQQSIAMVDDEEMRQVHN